MSEPESWEGWYSPHAAMQYGTVVWQREDGTEVHITAIGSGPYRWDDKEYVGRVVRFLRPGMAPRLPMREVLDR